MPYQLVVVRGRAVSPAVKLGPGVTTVGRQQDCQLRINSSQVSRKHCQLFEKKGLLIVKDMGSSNGTLVNGKKVDDQRVLEPGDELTIGGVKLRVEKVEAAAAAPGRKAGDTAVAAAVPVEEAGAVAIDGEDVFEIELDDKTTVTATAAPPAKPAPAPPAPAAKPAAPGNETVDVGEDAVADFLLNINLDDEE